MLALLVACFFWRVLFGGQVLLPASYLSHFEPWRHGVQSSSDAPWNALTWDAIAQYYPWRLYARQSLHAGEAPLWNAHQFCGAPFAANAQSALFYPLNIIFWLLPLPFSFGLSAAVHLFLAGLFMFLFLRARALSRAAAAFGAISFSFCGFFVCWAELPTLIGAAAWLPLGLYFVEMWAQRGSLAHAVGAGVSLAMAVLAGHPQIAFYVALCVGAYFLWRRRDRGAPATVRAAAAIAACAVGLAAIQILPTVEFLRHSHRAPLPGLLGLREYLRFAAPWQRLVTLAIPDFFGNPSIGNYWGQGNYAEYVAYAGALPLCLAPLARGRGALFFFALAVAALLVAFGTPLNAVFFLGVPGFRGSGGPACMLFLYMASICVLGAMALDQLLRRPRVNAAALSFVSVIFVAAGLAIIVIRCSPGASGLPLFAVLAPSMLNALVMLVVLGGALAALSTASKRKISPEMLAGVLIALLIFDLFMFGAGYNPVSRAAQVYPRTAATDFLLSRRSARVLPVFGRWSLRDFPYAILPPNSATAYGLLDAQGYDSICLARYKSFLAEVVGEDPCPRENGDMLVASDFNGLLAGRMGVGLVLSDQRVEGSGEEGGRTGVIGQPQQVRKVAQRGRTGIYALSDAMPLASVHAHASYVACWRDALTRLSANPFSPLLIVGRPGAVRIDVSTPKSARARWRPAQIVRRSANTILIRAESDQPAFLVVRDNFFPGWRAFVGRAEMPVLLADATFKAVHLPRGRHIVEMRYEPTTYRLGLFLSLCSLAALVALVLARPEE